MDMQYYKVVLTELKMCMKNTFYQKVVPLILINLSHRNDLMVEN